MIDRALQKQEAKDVLRGALVSPYLFTLLYLVLDLAMSGLDEYASLPARIAEVLQVEPWLAEELPPSLLQLSFPRLPAMFISILVLIPVFAAKNSAFAKFHANQGLILFIAQFGLGLVLGLLGLIPYVGVVFSILMWICEVVLFALSLTGLIYAILGKAKELS